MPRSSIANETVAFILWVANKAVINIMGSQSKWFRYYALKRWDILLLLIIIDGIQYGLGRHCKKI